MAKLQLNGNLTIVDSKTLTDADRAAVLAASDGHVKALRVTLLDTNGNEVVLMGKLYPSKAGSLTARFNAKVEGFEVVEVEDKESKQPQSDEEKKEQVVQELAGELGL